MCFVAGLRQSAGSKPAGRDSGEGPMLFRLLYVWLDPAMFSGDVLW